ncbi:hypothetical protein TIFTF001_031248 [Ficus carica]|uniref:RNase H type-1 domain-containing protein n=1 Tax=Ficus carica TaxID=3494 RepID=A0AA88DUG8_FICCA|nr:hypothetical protein TIFTF001_031248 [Ficus carica]
MRLLLGLVEFWGNYLVCNGLDEMKCNRAKPYTVKWCPPTQGYVKINVDAAVNNDMEFIGIGVVARHEDGTVLATAARQMFGRCSPHLGECMAVREGVWLAQSIGFSKWMVETDALKMFRAVQNPIVNPIEANVINDIRDFCVGLGSDYWTAFLTHFLQLKYANSSPAPESVVVNSRHNEKRRGTRRRDLERESQQHSSTIMERSMKTRVEHRRKS